MFVLWQLSLLALSLLATPSVSQDTCSPVNGVQFTAYGFPDASGSTAYGCNNDQVNLQAGGPTPLGDGSYAKPYSAAAGTGSTAFAQCSLVYIPYLRKYFRIADVCGGCGKPQNPICL